MEALGWTPLHDRVHRTLRQRQLLPKASRLLIAVSGGQDSLCLSRLLLDLQSKWDWQLAIAHCNHRWRTDADDNAVYVGQLAQQWQVPCFCETVNEPLLSEAIAREWRYQVLTDLALRQGYTAVVTGHTASDRAETLLYNLVRGSGMDGLQALTWQRPLAADVQLVRPLLNCHRRETGEFCQAANLRVWEDSTNQDWRYARNRIRQELLPYLQTHFNPQVEQSLAQTAEILRAEVEFLEAEGELLYEQAVTVHSGSSTDWCLDRSVLKQSPLALQRRVMKRFLQTVLLLAPSFEQVEKLTALITAPNRSQTDPFPGGAIARVEGDWIMVTKP
jgi:tRNA(Ile)-lysidine synthase